LLKWDPSGYDNKNYIVVPIAKVWTPDLTLYDSLDSEMNGMDKNRAIVYSDGSVYYNFPTLIEVICPIDVTSFPFDTQVCALLFGSWVYHGNQLDMLARDNPGDLSSMKTNVEWVIQKIVVERHELLVADKLPPSADSTPWIMFFFNFILGLSAVSTMVQKKVGDLIKDIEQSTNTELWQFLSVAIDRLGLVLFTLTLIGGSSYVWSAK
ncbi:hypothetical protein AM593_06753, partial [Mytilus galloprovincialis]